MWLLIEFNDQTEASVSGWSWLGVAHRLGWLLPRGYVGLSNMAAFNIKAVRSLPGS
jgi:hypothetical protein